MLFKSSENGRSKGTSSALWSEELTGQSPVQLYKVMVPAPKTLQSVSTSEDRWMPGVLAYILSLTLPSCSHNKLLIARGCFLTNQRGAVFSREP